MILVNNPALAKNLKKEGDRPNVCNSWIISKVKNEKKKNWITRFRIITIAKDKIMLAKTKSIQTESTFDKNNSDHPSNQEVIHLEHNLLNMRYITSSHKQH